MRGDAELDLPGKRGDPYRRRHGQCKGREAGPYLVCWRKGKGPGVGGSGDREVTGKSLMALWAAGTALCDMGAKEGVPGSIWLHPSSETQLW